MKTRIVKDAGGSSRRDRFSVLDFAEAARIPVARARKLIKDLGNDAEILMDAVEDRSRQIRARLRRPVL